MTNIFEQYGFSWIAACMILSLAWITPAFETDCSNFKKGKFIHKIPGVNFYVDRQEDFQIETDPETGYFSKLSIKWIDSCNYELLLLESTFPFPDSIQVIRKTIPLKVQIIATSKDFYVFRAHRDNSFLLTYTMWVDKTK